MNLTIGILVNDTVGDSIVEDIRYSISTLSLPLNIVILGVEKIHHSKLEVLLVFDDSLQTETSSHINYEHKIILSDFRNHIKTPFKLNVSYILLKILSVIINSYKIEISIVAILSLIEIFENKTNDFIENSRLNELNNIEKLPFKNTSILYIAGKATEFRDEFSITENGIMENNHVEITYDLRRFHFLQIDKLRFDPHNEQCAISNCEFIIEYADGEKIFLDEYMLNDSFTKGDKVYFLHDDSNIIFKPFYKTNPIYLNCSFTLESLEDTPYFKQQTSVKEVREHYNLLLDSGKLGVWSVKKNIENTQHVSAKKDFFIFLGPKSVGLEKLNNYFLDNAGELIKNKIIYPTHQREFFNREGRGSLYSLFSLKAEKFVIFDEHKALCLKKDILASKFKTLLLASEDFLMDDRLLSCTETFENAQYIYYFRDNLEFTFAKYKNDIYFNKCKDKFNIYILSGCLQIKYFFTILKYLSPSQIVLKEFTDNFFVNPNKIIEDSLNILGCNLPVPNDNKYEFNLSEISFIALEFRRLLNFYVFMDDRIVRFVQQALLEYCEGRCNYIFLTNEQEKLYSELFKEQLKVVFDVFNYSEGLKMLNVIYLTPKECIDQCITKEKINSVMMFLQQKNEDMYLRLVIELKLSKGVTTDNEEFNQFIDEL